MQLFLISQKQIVVENIYHEKKINYSFLKFKCKLYKFLRHFPYGHNFQPVNFSKKPLVKGIFQEIIVYRSRLGNQTTGNLIYWELRFASAFFLLHPFTIDKGPIFYENTVSWYVSCSLNVLIRFLYLSIYFYVFDMFKGWYRQLLLSTDFRMFIVKSDWQLFWIRSITIVLHFVWGCRYNGRFTFVST